ncbi:MAG: methyltransferase domain-containing protein [Chloroflexota bacterium]|nr:methyltransferase domain-containing protein [Chloroflexota bacterium]
MSELTNPEYLLTSQYKIAANLNARIQLHERFSVNKYDWQRWVFDHFTLLPRRGRILELGCGPGELWRKNGDRIPEGWDIVLSDFSPGMLQETRQNLQGIQGRFTFQQADAQAISFADEYFDAVVANHMLYHVPNSAKALAEIRRVLRSGARFYAATNGQKHMRELHELISTFVTNSAKLWSASSPLPFRLEGGREELSQSFAHVTLDRYEDALVVTEVEPLLAYILSAPLAIALDSSTIKQLTERIQQEIATHGAFHITKETGLFEAF